MRRRASESLAVDAAPEIGRAGSGAQGPDPVCQERAGVVQLARGGGGGRAKAAKRRAQTARRHVGSCRRPSPVSAPPR